MKSLLKIILLSIYCIALTSHAQPRPGSLKGTVLEKESGLAAICAAILVLDSAGNHIAGGVTDFDGNYNINPIPIGVYNLQFRSISFETVNLVNVATFSNLPTLIDVAFEASTFELIEVVVHTPPVQIIKKTTRYTTTCCGYITNCRFGLEAPQVFSIIKPLNVFPNPTKGKAEIQLEDGFTEVGLFNLQGRLILELEAPKTMKMDIDLSALPAGTYILKATGKDKAISEKLMLLH